jgi:hypothetical protein
MPTPAAAVPSDAAEEAPVHIRTAVARQASLTRAASAPEKAEAVAATPTPLVTGEMPGLERRASPGIAGFGVDVPPLTAQEHIRSSGAPRQIVEVARRGDVRPRRLVLSGLPAPLVPQVGAAVARKLNHSTLGPVAPFSFERDDGEPGEIHVHIDRLEVKAAQEAAPPKPERPPGRNPMSLDEYLSRRSRRSE